jgi:hypothetical protein
MAEIVVATEGLFAMLRVPFLRRNADNQPIGPQGPAQSEI